MASLGTFLIRVQGNLGADWIDYFDDISIVVNAPAAQTPISTLCTHSADQAALMGLLSRLYMFGYPILYLEYLGAGEASCPTLPQTHS